MTPPEISEGPRREYVAALLQCTGQLMSMVNQMAEYAANHAGAGDPVDVVLARLVEDALGELGIDPDDDAFAIAAELLRRTVETVGANIFFVDPSFAPGSRAARRARRPRRPC